MRVHYLTSIAAVNLGLLVLILYPFSDMLLSLWLPLVALPYFLLYARDLGQCRYQYRDLFRVYALNLLLIPINLAGVFRSIQQGVTKKHIRFGRTPKIAKRTAAPARYVLAEYVLAMLCLAGMLNDLWYARWLHMSFGLINALFLLFGILHFIGLRESMTDIGFSLPKLQSAQQPWYGSDTPWPFLRQIRHSFSSGAIPPAEIAE